MEHPDFDREAEPVAFRSLGSQPAARRLGPPDQDPLHDAGEIAPPHFAVFGNQLDALPKSYTRYLVNGLREAFDLPGTPIRVSLRMGQNPFDKERK